MCLFVCLCACVPGMQSSCTVSRAERTDADTGDCLQSTSQVAALTYSLASRASTSGYAHTSQLGLHLFCRGCLVGQYAQRQAPVAIAPPPVLSLSLFPTPATCRATPAIHLSPSLVTATEEDRLGVLRSVDWRCGDGVRRVPAAITSRRLWARLRQGRFCLG